MGLGWEEIDKTLDLGYIRVAGLHRECKPAVLFDPPNFRPRTMTHVCMYIICTYVHTYLFASFCYANIVFISYTYVHPFYAYMHT